MKLVEVSMEYQQMYLERNKLYIIFPIVLLHLTHIHG